MAIFKLENTDNQYDVVICGGGLAGHTLARQLTLTYDDITILLIEKASYPVPLAAHKVGESSAGIGGHYFTQVLQLQQYFTNNQYKKLGFRYFFGESVEDFSVRPELGISKFPLHEAVQIDRGQFENDLYDMNRLAGVEILTETSVNDIVIYEGADFNQVTFTEKDGQEKTVKSRWVIDAMGRRRLLQRKFKLTKPPTEQHNSSWFRIKGRIDVEDLVPESNQQWHQRLTGKIRYFATNHLMGKGYWVWLIPLASGHTSIGIVTAEKNHPFANYNTYTKSLAWLKDHEPALYEYIKDMEVLDFKAMRNYSYSSEQIFSLDRWACTGEAAVFPDPFYSPGSNLITFENSIITQMIGLDVQENLKKEDIDHYNQFVISQNDWLTYTIQSAYSYFWHEQIFALNFIWDLSVDKASPFAHLINNTFLDREKYQGIQKASKKLFKLLFAISNLFKDWESKTLNRFSYEYLDYYSIPFLASFHNGMGKPDHSLSELIDDQLERLEKLEELAQIIFLLAVEDTMPEKLPMLVEPMWVNAWAISLKSEKWEKDGLFQPTTAPRDLKGIAVQFGKLFKIKNDDHQITLLGLLEDETPEKEPEKILTQFNF